MIVKIASISFRLGRGGVHGRCVLRSTLDRKQASRLHTSYEGYARKKKEGHRPWVKSEEQNRRGYVTMAPCQSDSRHAQTLSRERNDMFAQQPKDGFGLRRSALRFLSIKVSCWVFSRIKLPWRSQKPILHELRSIQKYFASR